MKTKEEIVKFLENEETKREMSLSANDYKALLKSLMKIPDSSNWMQESNRIIDDFFEEMYFEY